MSVSVPFGYDADDCAGGGVKCCSLLFLSPFLVRKKDQKVKKKTMEVQVLERKFWASAGQMKAHLRYAIEAVKTLSVTLKVTRLPPQYDIALGQYARFERRLDFTSTDIYQLSVDLNLIA